MSRYSRKYINQHTANVRRELERRNRLSDLTEKIKHASVKRAIHCYKKDIEDKTSWIGRDFYGNEEIGKTMKEVMDKFGATGKFKGHHPDAVGGIKFFSEWFGIQQEREA